MQLNGRKGCSALPVLETGAIRTRGQRVGRTSVAIADPLIDLAICA